MIADKYMVNACIVFPSVDSYTIFENNMRMCLGKICFVCISYTLHSLKLVNELYDCRFAYISCNVDFYCRYDVLLPSYEVGTSL